VVSGEGDYGAEFAPMRLVEALRVLKTAPAEGHTYTAVQDTPVAVERLLKTKGL